MPWDILDRWRHEDDDSSERRRGSRRRFFIGGRRRHDNAAQRERRWQREEVGPNGWVCHVCNDYRPDAAISVFSRIVTLANGISIQENVRHCNDRPSCVEGAEAVKWLSV